MKHAVLIVLLILTAGVRANDALLTEVLGRDATFDANVPTPEAVIGVTVGERHLYHHEIVRYLDALADASPRMMSLGKYGETYGGRALMHYAISSEANLAKLDEIRAARADIIDPDASPDLSGQPAVLHMMYSVHGNEASAANVTPLAAYYLAAGRDAALAEQLDNVVIIFNPILNADGFDRFANWSNNHSGLVPNPDPNDREHNEPSPNGRTNYYWFDLNRDWLPHQHPESQGRLALFHEWKPNVQLDFHEMGSNSTYFFMPGKPERTHPLTPEINQVLTAKIGEYHARAFDKDGVLYFSEEGFDDFFMGKGSTYPDLFGSVGILFEQGSSRGMVQDTQNGTRTFADAISNQFRMSLSSLEATAALKDELLNYQREFYTETKRARGYYLAKADGDPTRLNEFIRVLEGHGIVVEGLGKDVRANGETYRAGEAIAVSLDQPQSTYLQSLWNRQVEFEENVFYDVSTWTMPWAFNLTHTREPVRSATTVPLQDGLVRRAGMLETSNIGYLIDWRDSASAKLLYALLDADANVRVTERTFTARIIGKGEIPFGYGTLFVAPELGKTIPDAAMALMRSAAEAGAPVYPVESSSTSRGIDLGSRDFTVLEKPKVILITGPGTSAYNTGEIWHLLDRRVQMPLTMVDAWRLSRVDLSDYTHVILTNPLRTLPDATVKKIDAFVKGGGVLWAQGSSTLDWLHKREITSVLWRDTEAQKTRKELTEKKKSKKADQETLEKLLPERRAFADARDEAAFRLVRGAILHGNVDISHPIGYGYTDEFLPVFRRTNRFMARSENPYSTPVIYAEEPLLSGYMSDENRLLAAGSAGIIVDERGDGAMVLALDSVAFRAFWWGTQKLLLNAIFFGELLEEPN